MNKVVGIGIFGLLTAAAVKVFGMKTLSDKLVVTLTKPQIYKVDVSGITFRTNITLKNPTRFEMTITRPVINLLTNGKVLSSTTPEGKKYEIKPISSTVIDNIKLKLPITYLTGISLKDLLAAFKGGDAKQILSAIKVPLEVQYSLYANKFYYESTPEKILS